MARVDRESGLGRQPTVDVGCPAHNDQAGAVVCVPSGIPAQIIARRRAHWNSTVRRGKIALSGTQKLARCTRLIATEPPTDPGQRDTPSQSIGGALAQPVGEEPAVREHEGTNVR